ncbi:MAG: hypothetical protein EAS52_04210 [Parapedobacter sp.]|nr:MAG: hypothetical protein EAS52_04210 [Parapedobacter sp.]
MNSILKRIKEIAQQEGLSVTALEAAIGASKGVFSRALANGTDIQSKWVVKLAENYPHYSAEWLLKGEGEMKKADILTDLPENYSPPETSKLTDELIHTLKQVISSQETTIRSQEITIDALKQRIAALEQAK